MSEQMSKQDKKEYEEWLASTYKRQDVNRDMADWLYECVDEELFALWKKHCNRFCFHPMKDYAAYGDTYVDTPSYITDEEDQRCREEFEKDVTPQELIDALSINTSFKDCLSKIISSWASEKDLEV